MPGGFQRQHKQEHGKHWNTVRSRGTDFKQLEDRKTWAFAIWLCHLLVETRDFLSDLFLCAGDLHQGLGSSKQEAKSRNMQLGCGVSQLVFLFLPRVCSFVNAVMRGFLGSLHPHINIPSNTALIWSII